MKRSKRFFVFALSVALMCSLTTAFAATITAQELSSSPSLDIVEYFSDYNASPNFGGIYYDDDGNLVVNVVEDQSALFHIGPPNIANIRYRSVLYSLVELESIKDYLAEFMDEYAVIALDANEVTNQVDIYLTDYNSETINEITNIALAKCEDSSVLNFIDSSGVIVQYSVATEEPKNYTYDDFVDFFAVENSSSRASRAILISGNAIKMNNFWYSMGPATAARSAYSAGHGLGFGNRVYYDYRDVGLATPHFGGGNGDWSSIEIDEYNSFTLTFTKSTPTVNSSVCMIGATSGKTTGKVTSTNITVTVEGTRLTGMCTATYQSDSGDSGAGVYLNTTPVTKYVGVQSATAYDSSGNPVHSLFTPSTKLT